MERVTKVKYTYEWTDYEDYSVSNCNYGDKEYIVCEEAFWFEDWLRDCLGLSFEQEGDKYYVTDSAGDRTGEAYWLVSTDKCRIIRCAYTRHYDESLPNDKNFDQPMTYETIICDEDCRFEDWLDDNAFGFAFEKEGDIYHEIDKAGNRNGGAFWLIDEDAGVEWARRS